MDANGTWYGLMHQPPRILIIGAGSRGNGYSRAIAASTNGIVAAVAEPITFKRQELGRRYIWSKTGESAAGQEFEDWRDFLTYEMERRKRKAAGEDVEAGIDAVFVCVLDEQHAEIITVLAPLGLHMMSEKPLATTLDDCLNIYSSLLPEGQASKPNTIFGIGHVLRYSPHNDVLRKLLLKERVIGDILSIEHTEPVGWWHFSHSYVRGNWRKESWTAPSLLTKSCHDIDLILWLLCSPPCPLTKQVPALQTHLPSTISSQGHLTYFRRKRKPAEAKDATNCMSCPTEPSCKYSAKKIYSRRHLRQGNTGWPVKIIDPEIEDCYRNKGVEAAELKLFSSLSEDYSRNNMTQQQIDQRPWFGRCVWESDNDVVDDQVVTLTWDDGDTEKGQYAKTATFHMIAHTEAQCERRGRVYGTEGEISYDSKTIRIFKFATGEEQIMHPKQMPGGHGGGDDGLVRQFVDAVDAVKNRGMDVEQAQREYIGCTLEDVVRSHGAVFAAEQSRREGKIVRWAEWWSQEVERKLMERRGWDVVGGS